MKLLTRPTDDPRWVRPAALSLLVATGVLYIWGLGASGWANSFYSAAVQAGTVSWKAFFFGSSDAANSITVDKSPLALWPMELTARVFGVNSWSILVPEALEGVAAVGLLYLTIKRWFGAGAGLIAGAVMATTPVAVLMFRFNNPDAALVLLLVAAAYFITRAVEDGHTKWLVASGAMIGLAFLAKELQAFIIIPILVGVYLLTGPQRLGRRMLQIVAMGASTIAAAGWWVAIITVWPASSRPYIGGSQNNTFFDVLFGYNGLGRISGNETGSVGGMGGGAGGGMWGATGITRMFNSQFGGQASWLIPTALLIIFVGLIATLRRPRVDRVRAALLLWGGWLVLTGVLFSLSKGIIHEYYTVALAPAIGAVIGIGAIEGWRRRELIVWRNLLALGVVLSAGWSFVLLNRTPDWLPWLRWMVLVLGVIAAMVLLFSGSILEKIRTPLAVSLLVVGFAGPLAYSLETASTPHSGAIPTAGPASAGLMGRFGGGGLRPGGGGGGLPGGFELPEGFELPNGMELPGGMGFPGGAGGAGGLLDGSRPSDAMIALLEADSSNYTWVAATVGANQAAGYQLATGLPVMPIGGFNGSDPSPTLEQFQRYVSDGQIHYFIAGSMGGPMGGGSSSTNTSQQITDWVTSNFTSQSIDGTTVYDLSSTTNS